MSYLIPYWLLGVDQTQKYRQMTIEYAVKRGLIIGLAAKQSGLVVEDLTPPDLGLQSWETPPCRAGELTEWFTTPDALDKVIAIYKVTQLEFRPKIDRLQVVHGAEAHFYELSQLYIYGHEGYFSEPYILEGRFTVSVGTSRAVRTGQRLLLSGFVVRTTRSWSATARRAKL